MAKINEPNPTRPTTPNAGDAHTPMAAVPEGALPPATRAHTPFLDEVNRIDQAQRLVQSDRKVSFGAWARAKGVTPERVRQRSQEGKLNMSGWTGDGPEMTEGEFDELVGFTYQNTFGDLPGVKHHIPAEQARGGPTELEREKEPDLAPSKDPEQNPPKRNV